MGRRGANADRINTARMGEAVHRALGRLFTRAQVQQLPVNQGAPVVVAQAARAIAPPVLHNGAGEHAWQPAANVSQTVIPRAAPGGRGENLLPAVRFVAPNCAVAAPDCRQMPPLPTTDAGRVRGAELAWALEVALLPAAFWTLPSAPLLRGSHPLLTTPPVGRLENPRQAAPKISAVRIPRPSAPRACWGGDAVLGRMALTRRGRDAPPGVPPALAFAPERRRLAEATSAAEEDILLLGVYPGVPILAVSRIVVEEEGRRLRLWLKPEVLRGRGGGRLITLLVGRRVSDGKMLQAAL